jgi:uncharacterized protein with GYD domain
MACDVVRISTFLFLQKEWAMATYISTVRFTETGLKNIRDTGKRAAAFKSAAKKMGVKVAEVYWTLGPFDGLLIFEAPDDESATAAMLQLSSAGNVHTQTVRAFKAPEMEAILGKLGG